MYHICFIHSFVDGYLNCFHVLTIVDHASVNIGVDCHFLLQCMKMKSESEVVQSYPTPSYPMDCSPPGPPVHGIFQARVLEWVAIASSELLVIHFK